MSKYMEELKKYVGNDKNLIEKNIKNIIETNFKTKNDLYAKEVINIFNKELEKINLKENFINSKLEKEFTFVTADEGSKTESKKVKNLNELANIINEIAFIGIDEAYIDNNIKEMNNSLIYFIKSTDQKEFEEFLKTFKEVCGFYYTDYIFIKNLAKQFDNNFKELAEDAGIEDFNINIVKNSPEELYEKLNQIAKAKEKDLDKADLKREEKDGCEISKDEQSEIIIEEEEEQEEELDKTARRLSDSLSELEPKTLTAEEINSFKDPDEFYNKIIKPALEGVDNINIDKNPITAILKNTDSKKFSPEYKTILKNNLKNFINKLLEENKEKLKNILSTEEVKKKLNEISKENSGLSLGNLLLNNLNKENSIGR